VLEYKNVILTVKIILKFEKLLKILNFMHLAIFISKCAIISYKSLVITVMSAIIVILLYLHTNYTCDITAKTEKLNIHHNKITQLSVIVFDGS
jgi:ABC-type transport system involved in multi-copper enzyme maturation permease subunit